MNTSVKCESQAGQDSRESYGNEITSTTLCATLNRSTEFVSTFVIIRCVGHWIARIQIERATMSSISGCWIKNLTNCRGGPACPPFQRNQKLGGHTGPPLHLPPGRQQSPAPIRGHRDSWLIQLLSIPKFTGDLSMRLV